MKIVTCFFLVFLIISPISVPAQTGIRLEINSKLPARYIKKKGLIEFTFTAAAQMFPYIEISIKQIDYLIAFDRKSRKIKYIYTTDEDFQSADGQKVGQEITVKWDDIRVLGYFQLRGPADKDGWEAVIGGSSAFDGDFVEKVEKAGQLTTEIEGFVKGYNY